MTEEIASEVLSDAPRRPGRKPRSATIQATSEDVRPAVRRERKRKGGQLMDKFALPAEVMARFKANGQSIEWKRESLMGQADPHYDVRLREQGWLPVDSKHYPELVPNGFKGPIRMDGMVLMERPVELTAEARAEDTRDARAQVRTKEQQLGATPNDNLPRKVLSHGRSYEPVAVPE